MPALTVTARDEAGNTATVNVPFAVHRPPDPPQTGALFGSSRVADLPPVVTAVDACRIYLSGTIPTSWTSRAVITDGMRKGARHFIISTKTADAAGLRRFLATKPADVTVYLTYYHEHEGNLRDGSLTLAQYDAGTRIVAGVAHEFDGVLYGPIHNGNNPAPGGGWHVGGWVEATDTSVYDFWGADCYAPDGEDPAERFAPLVAEARRRGLPLVVGETGTPQGPSQAAWCGKARAWALANDVTVCYWHSQTSSGDENWRLTDASARAFFGLTS
jgi:hypothetical protein